MLPRPRRLDHLQHPAVQHRLGAGIFARYLPPVIGSAPVINFAELERQKHSPRGEYVLEPYLRTMVIEVWDVALCLRRKTGAT